MVAAFADGLLGALWGASAVPFAWQRTYTAGQDSAATTSSGSAPYHSGGPQ